MGNHNYTFGERLLHHLALGGKSIAELSFDLEKASSPLLSVNNRSAPVFVSGLARSGTTILMRSFNQTGFYRSLTYNDMPFVLMPGIWKRLTNWFRAEGKLAERVHGDGIKINFNSPEALEEVFWRVFCSSDYISNTYLSPHDVSDEVRDDFIRYVNLVLASAEGNKKRSYLSKNNNNILRISTIREAFPCALIIIPFRKPYDQARSLLRQHRSLMALSKSDTFLKRYMQYLAHHEFGADHRPFVFRTRDYDQLKTLDVDSISYWLQIWANTYRYLLDIGSRCGCVFVSFEKLCEAPAETLELLFKQAKLDLDPVRAADLIKTQPNSPLNTFDTDIDEPQSIYEQLMSISL